VVEKDLLDDDSIWRELSEEIGDVFVHLSKTIGEVLARLSTNNPKC
jgi:hypothetical protein